MIACPDGRRVDVHDRLTDIHARHENEYADLLARDCRVCHDRSSPSTGSNDGWR